MPDGKEGNIPAGLFQTLCLSNQKQRGHSPIKLSEDGDSVKVGVDMLKNTIRIT